jgi:hypothetical protein
VGPTHAKMKIIALFCFVFLAFHSEAQYRKYNRKKPKNSMAEGTGFVYWGYNRSAYTKSNIHFEGLGYDFMLNGVKAKDRPSTKLAEYVNLTKLTVPQFNLRIGYNFKNYWNVSLGYDHLKYVMVHGPTYQVVGNTDAGFNSVEPLNGYYTGINTTTEEEVFHYENSNGMNYIRAEISKVKNLIRNRADTYTMTWLWGFSSGVILSYNDFTYNGTKTMVTSSLSGVAASLHTGMRFEFWKHLFLQANTGAGYIFQHYVKTRPDEYDTFARHRFGYVEGNVVLGCLFYIRPVNDCNSCPHW